MTKNSFTVWKLPQGAMARYGWGALCDLAVSADGTFLAAGTGMGVWWYDLTTHQMKYARQYADLSQCQHPLRWIR